MLKALGIASTLVASACLTFDAQANSTSENGLDDSVFCMSRVTGNGHTLSVYLPGAFSGTLAEKGFQPVDCQTAFTTRSSVKGYRDTICDMAVNPSSEMQAQHASNLGESPAILCAFAEAVAGQWVPRQSRTRS